MGATMGERDTDVVVIGGGHNGLIAAALLARAGVRVRVFEARDALGGFAGTVVLDDGARANLAADDFGLLRLDLLAELELERHGLVWEESPVFGVLAPSRGEALVLWRDVGAGREVLARRARGDGARFPELLGAIAGLAERLDALARAPASLRSHGALLRDAELVRCCGLSADAALGQWLEDPGARALLGALACQDVPFGPLAWSSGMRLLWRLVGSTAAGLRPVRRPRGGAERLARALRGALVAAGGIVETGTAVRRVLTERAAGERPRAIGVELADGREVSAQRVLSSLDPATTLLGLVGSERLDIATARALRNTRYRGVRARVLATLDEPVALELGSGLAGSTGPAGSSWPGGFARLIVADAPSDLERAADAAKYGQWSRSPWLEVWPQEDPRVLAINAQCAPHTLRSGPWSEEDRRGFVGSVLAVLQRALPGIASRVSATRLLLPADWERELSAREGSGTHGEQSLEQMFGLRGVPGWEGATTPVSGLLLCGAGAHPGGDVTGLPGWHAARRTLATL